VAKARQQSPTPTDAATERFIHVEILIHLRKRLAETANAAQQHFLALLAEKKAKGHLAND
jgi:hypothetical protein